MKKIALPFFLCIFLATVTYSQTFNNRYIIDQTAIVFRNLIQTEDTIITMGLGSSLYSPFPSKLMFTRFDQEGEVLDYDLIIADSFTHYYPLWSSLQDRKVVAVGGAGGSLSNQSGFYAMYDLDNGLEWIKQYYPPNGWTMFFEKCLLMEDKIYILANLQNHNAGSIISTKLICLNLLGNILWEEPFENNNHDIISRAIILNQDSTIYIGLSRIDEPFIQFESEIKSLIYKIDLEGNIIAEWENDENNTYRPEQIIEAGDSNLLFVGRYLSGYNSDEIPLFQGYISKVDSLNNRAWSLKTGKPTFTTDMNNLIATSDGNYLAIGVTFDSLSSSMVATESGHLIKFNIDGEVIWERRHYAIDSGAEYNKLYDGVELVDSSFLFCGESVNFFDDYPNQGWLLKLDQYGCLIPGCHLLDSTSDLPDKTFEVLLYPNPASDQLNIYISEHLKNGNAAIIDLSGKIINQFDVLGNNATYIYDVSGLATGIYFLKIQDEDGRILTKEFVVQR